MFKWYYYDFLIFLLASNFQKNPKAFMSIQGSMNKSTLRYGQDCIFSKISANIHIFSLIKQKKTPDFLGLALTNQTHGSFGHYGCKKWQTWCTPLLIFKKKKKKRELGKVWVNKKGPHSFAPGAKTVSCRAKLKFKGYYWIVSRINLRYNTSQ